MDVSGCGYGEGNTYVQRTMQELDSYEGGIIPFDSDTLKCILYKQRGGKGMRSTHYFVPA